VAATRTMPLLPAAVLIAAADPASAQAGLIDAVAAAAPAILTIFAVMAACLALMVAVLSRLAGPARMRRRDPHAPPPHQRVAAVAAARADASRLTGTLLGGAAPPSAPAARDAVTPRSRSRSGRPPGPAPVVVHRAGGRTGGVSRMLMWGLAAGAATLALMLLLGRLG
jgi:hypothetical protein